MVLIRMLTQIVDIIISIVVLVVSFLYVLPMLNQLGIKEQISAVLMFMLSIAFITLIQLPFMKVGQTVGKAFLGLEIRTKHGKHASMSILFQREVFLKLASCYLICIPILFGKLGGHELATETTVAYTERRKK